MNLCNTLYKWRYFFEAIPANRRRKIKLLDINSLEEIPAETADPQKAKKQQQPSAEIGLCYCNQLFRIERTLKDMDAQDRKARRLELEVPVWDDFWDWLGTLKPLGGSKLEKAVNYAKNHQELLGNYLLDGRSGSNDAMERIHKGALFGGNEYRNRDA